MTDELFSQIWINSRYNSFFWATHAIGILCLVGGFIAGWKGFLAYRRIALLLCCLLCVLTVVSVAKKWHIREAAAQTIKQKQAVADRDSANLGLSPLMGVSVAVFYWLFFCVVFRLGESLGRQRQMDGREGME